MTGYENRLSDVQNSVLSANLKGLSYREIQDLAKEVRSVTNKPIKLNSERSVLELYIVEYRDSIVPQFETVTETELEETEVIEVLTNDLNGYTHQFTDGNLTAIKFGFNDTFHPCYYNKYETMFTRMNSCPLTSEDENSVYETPVVEPEPTPKKLDLTSLPSPNDLSVASKSALKTSKPAKRTNTPKADVKVSEGKVKVTYKKPDEYTYKQSDRPYNYSKAVDYRLMNERIKARKEGKTYSMNPLFSDLQQTTKSRLVDTGHKHPKGASVYVSPTKVITYK